MKFGELNLRLCVVGLISTGEIKITSGIEISSMVLKLPCELVIWSLDSKSSRRDLLGTRIPTFSGICQWNKIRPRHGISPSLMNNGIWRATIRSHLNSTQQQSTTINNNNNNNKISDSKQGVQHIILLTQMVASEQH